jgi:molybdopterin/thiamine biosynthesis adenylyltransferase
VTAVAHSQPVQRLGLGFLAGADLVIAGLDSREARLWVGQACRKLGLTWVDGAIEGLRGLARVFLPDGACYECTLGETDRAILAQRRACALLSPEDMTTGKVPTNATTAALVAALQVQEAVKVLVGRPDLLALRNSALVFTGDTLETYHLRYTEDEFCQSHDRYETLRAFPVTDETTLADIAAAGAASLGALDALELEDDLITAARCSFCEHTTSVLRIRSALQHGDGLCPRCKEQLTLDARRTLAPDDELLAVRIALIELPQQDVLTVRHGGRRMHFALRLDTVERLGEGD